MSPQLTLQTPLQLPPEEIPSYLNQLWSNDQPSNTGANTFCLIVWQPAWIEQQLVQSGKIKGPIIGTQHKKLIEAARKIILEKDLPHSTPPLDRKVSAELSIENKKYKVEDLRGQHINEKISDLKPRRLITLAPTLEDNHPLETLVAAYCPLLEEGGGQYACGDVVVLRGAMESISNGLNILDKLLPSELPSWLWWDGSLDEAQDLFNKLALQSRRLIIDTALGDPLNCLHLLKSKISESQAVNDLNWLRLRSWRESLAMVFDPPHRRNALDNVVQLDIDVEGNHPVQGLLLTAWIAERLNWKVENCNIVNDHNIEGVFSRPDKTKVEFCLIGLPVGKPSIHPGQIIGIRLICIPDKLPENALCVILGAESKECMRLEAGGMANMELLEEVVPIQTSHDESDVARLLGTSRGSTSPLLSAAAPIAHKLFELTHKKQ